MLKKLLCGTLKKPIRRIVDENTAPTDGLEDEKDFTLERHPQCEILFAAHGKSLFSLAGKVFRADEGDVFIIRSWTPHSFGYRKCDSELCHIWFSLTEGRLSFNSVEVGANGAFSSNAHAGLSQDTAGVLMRRLEENRDLENIIRLVLEETSEALETPPRETDALIESVRRYIESANARECSLKHLAAIHKCSVSRIAHGFRNAFAMSVGEYIGLIRMRYTESAKKHGLSQKEIAAELGFSSPASFWRWRNTKKREKNV